MWGTRWCETNILQNLKKHVGGHGTLLYILTVWKSGGTCPPYPHLIAPMGEFITTHWQWIYAWNPLEISMMLCDENVTWYEVGLPPLTMHSHNMVAVRLSKCWVIDLLRLNPEMAKYVQCRSQLCQYSEFFRPGIASQNFVKKRIWINFLFLAVWLYQW